VRGVKLLAATAVLLLALAAAASAAPPRARDYDPVFSPDGRTIAFVHNSGTSASIQLIDAAGAHRRTLVPRVFGQYLAWSPDGTSLAYSDGYDIWRADVATGTATRLTNDDRTKSGGDESWQPAWSPDGKTIAYTHFQTCYRCSTIWSMNADGTGAHQVYDSYQARRPAFSPDGTRLALSLANDLVIDLDGHAVVGPAGAAYAIWSSKGTYVAYTGGGLWVRNLQTGVSRRVTGKLGAQIAWSGDGKWIAGGSRGAVAVAWAKDGSHLRVLPGSAIASTPAFSHGLLAYVHAGECGIDVAREDGTQPRRVTKSC
jgi:Tol biopolymer transport system component